VVDCSEENLSMTDRLQGSPSDLARLDALKAMGDLPSPKGVALEIMRATQGEDVSTAELARIIKTDPAFSGRLIKAANGLLGYGRRPVASVQDALMVMGMPAVRSLALGFSLLSNYRSGRCSAFDYDAYWSSSLMRAVAVQLFTQHTRCAPPDEAYCIGLLSRAGELVLATIYPDRYSELIVECAGNRDLLVQRENEAFALNHRELTAMMLSDWGIPGVYADAVRQHEALAMSGVACDSREARLAVSLALAAQLGVLCELDAASASERVPALNATGLQLGIATPALHETCDRAIREWADWSVLLRVPARAVVSIGSLIEGAVPQGGAESSVRIGSAAERAPAAVSPNAPASKGHMRVLLAEADAGLRTEIRQILDEAGHEVQEVDSIELAAEAALVMQPHMMIIDWVLPDGCGLKLVERLRQTRVGRGIYVLVLTSHENEQRLVEAFECGVDDFITKPLNARVLLARMRAGLRVVRLHQEVEQDREEIRQFAADLAVSNRKLQEGTLTDSLTGFPNRRYFAERLAQEWAASSRTGRPLACLAIDLDGFKRINDTYGHDVGDAVLMQASKALKEGLRSNDVVARTGGDEFLVLCPETNLDAARMVAERICKQIAATQVRAGRLQLSISASIGVAMRGEGVENAEDLVKKSDEALLFVKASQRGAVKESSSVAVFGLSGVLTH
jgi:two-component system, cell cycle response regulator